MREAPIRPAIEDLDRVWRSGRMIHHEQALCAVLGDMQAHAVRTKTSRLAHERGRGRERHSVQIDAQHRAGHVLACELPAPVERREIRHAASAVDLDVLRAHGERNGNAGAGEVRLERGELAASAQEVEHHHHDEQDEHERDPENPLEKPAAHLTLAAAAGMAARIFPLSGDSR